MSSGEKCAFSTVIRIPDAGHQRAVGDPPDLDGASAPAVTSSAPSCEKAAVDAYEPQRAGIVRTSEPSATLKSLTISGSVLSAPPDSGVSACRREQLTVRRELDVVRGHAGSVGVAHVPAVGEPPQVHVRPRAFRARGEELPVGRERDAVGPPARVQDAGCDVDLGARGLACRPGGASCRPCARAAAAAGHAVGLQRTAAAGGGDRATTRSSQSPSARPPLYSGPGATAEAAGVDRPGAARRRISPANNLPWRARTG